MNTNGERIMIYYGTKDGNQYGGYTNKDNLKSYIEYSDDEWKDIINNANLNNKILSHDENGKPILIDYVQKTDEEKLADGDITEKEYKQKKLFEYLQKLADTDYVPIKIFEGAATKDDYKEILENREVWRNAASKLKEEISLL